MRISALIRRLAGCERGVSAVEFALISPILMLGAIATFDAGSAVYQKMVINQALRSAADSAIATGDVTTVTSVLTDTAEANFSVISGNTGDQDTLAVNVARYCVCPVNPDVSVACTTTCSGVAAHELFGISASKTYTGILLPAMTLEGSLDVLAP